jgi:hypothetical protein
MADAQSLEMGAPPFKSPEMMYKYGNRSSKNTNLLLR